MNRTFSTILAAILIAQPAFAQAPSSALTKIGAAAAVRGAVKAVAPNATVGRVIGSGKTLYLNDHVTTDAAGHLQVLLLDESVFTLGPSSDMVLDEFVYDPNTSNGKVAANLVKGTFRFVTGKVAHKDPEQMKLKLAVGTIGIRGSVGVVQTDANGSTVINAGAGGGNDAGESSAGIFVSNNGQTTDLSRPGFGATILPGQGPSGASNMSDRLNTLMSSLAPQTARGGGNGSGGSDPAAGSGSAGSTSGKNTAAGGVLANAASDTNALGDAQNTVTQNAIQQAALFASGDATWQDVLTINQGTAFYFNGHNSVSCSGGGCTGGSGYLGSLQLYVDFNARTLGGGGAFTGPSGINGSFVHIHGIETGSPTETIQMLIGAGGSGLQPMTFAGLTGPATFTLNSNNTGSFSSTNSGDSGNFNGSVLTFQNSNGAAATGVKINLVYTGQNISSQSQSVSGTFVAPKQ